MHFSFPYTRHQSLINIRGTDKAGRRRRSLPSLPADVSRTRTETTRESSPREGEGSEGEKLHGQGELRGKLRRRGGVGEFMHRLRDFQAANLIAFRGIPFASRERAELANVQRNIHREREITSS